MKSEIGFIGVNLSGDCKHYYENGQLKTRGNYLNGKRNDTWSIYYENGQLKAQGDVFEGQKMVFGNGIMIVVK